jgi:hypothetical protein
MAGVSPSWSVHHNFCFTHSSGYQLFQGPFKGTVTLQPPAWPPRPSFEISVEVTMTPQLLHSAPLQNQQHVDNSKICCPYELYLGHLNHSFSSL